jgi:hypothetical protein
MDEKNKKNQGIDFGWIIGPKYLFSDRNDNKIKFYHAAVHNSLSAVISVPSWWTAINLEIDTCWVDKNDISRLKKTEAAGVNLNGRRNYIHDLCDPESAGTSHNVDIDYLVRLPGSTEELPRKFSYEIERVPAITKSDFLADFYVGQKKASLIIQGKELWRSTVVTMGHQKADNIEVLPNMKGIIATFNKVNIPSKRIEHYPEGKGRQEAPAFCFVNSEVVVWTSEGRTPESQLFARIHANPLFGPGSDSEEGKDYPDGFGQCFQPSPNEQPASPQEMQTDSTNQSSGETNAEN